MMDLKNIIHWHMYKNL